MSRPETRAVPRTEARSALLKAREFMESGKASLAASRWNAAGLDSVHAGIAAADAVLIGMAGLRSVARDHSAVVVLLERETSVFTAAQRRHLAGLLKMKNQVAYDQRLVTEAEARQMVDAATRLLSWALSTLGSESER